MLSAGVTQSRVSESRGARSSEYAGRIYIAMKRLFVWMLLGILFTVTVLFTTACSSRNPFKHGVRNGDMPCWTKDGSGLFYTVYKDESATEPVEFMYRYDVITARKHRYRLPLKAMSPHTYLRDYDVSPDGQALVLAMGRDIQEQKSAVYTWDLMTSRTTKIASPRDWGRGVAWLADNRIVYPDQYGKDSNIWSVRPDGTDRKRLLRQAGLSYGASDGSGFLYYSRGGYHRYDVSTNTSSRFRPPPGRIEDESFECIGLLKDRALFLSSEPGSSGRLKRFRDGRTETVSLPDVFSSFSVDNGLSPKGTHLWAIQQSQGGDWGFDIPRRLFILDLPPETVRAIRQP